MERAERERKKVEKQPPVPSKSPTVSNQETDDHEELSPKRFSKAQQLIDQYGTDEGLRRLREMDPEAARQFERGRRGAPAREVPKDNAYSDDQSSDDAP